MRTRELLHMWTYPKNPEIVPRIIRWRLGTEYSHVCMAVYVSRLRDYRVYQASNCFVNTVMLRNFLKYNHVIFSASEIIVESDFNKALVYMEAQTGKRYSFLGAIASTFDSLKNLGIGNDDDITFICSEYSYRTRQQFIDHEHAVDSDYVLPQILEEYIRDDGVEILEGLHQAKELAYLKDK